MEGFSVVLDVDPTRLRGLRHRLSSWLEDAGASQADNDSIVLATHEAAAHAMETGESGSTIEVTASRDALDGGLTVDVTSERGWEALAPETQGTRLALLAGLVSEVSMRSSTTLRMRKDPQ